MKLSPVLAPRQLSLLGWDRTKSSDWEIQQVSDLGIAWTNSEALADDPASAARASLAPLADCDAIAVHFDVDVVDFMDAALSEDPNRNIGVPLAAALTAVRTLVRDSRVRILTVTEINPDHGEPDGSTLRRFVAELADALSAWG